MKTKRLFYTSLTGITLLAGAYQFWGCEGHISGLILSRGGTNESGNVEEIDPPEGEEGSFFQEKWSQPEDVAALKTADVLFIVDSSGSMEAEVDATAKSMSTFIGTLVDQGVDICVAMTWGFANGPYAGKFVAATNKDEDRVLCSSNLDTPTLVSKLEANLRTSSNDFIPGTGTPYVSQAISIQNDGGESGFAAAKASIAAAALSVNQGLGFFRSNALLALNFESDENEISTSKYFKAATSACSNQAPSSLCDLVTTTSFSPAGPATVVDGENCCYESYARQEFYSDSTGKLILGEKELVRDFKLFQGTLPLIVNAITYNDPATIPAGGENEIGYGMIEAADRSGGDKIDLALATLAGANNAAAQQELNEGFVNFANAIVNSSYLYTVFDLKNKVCPLSVILTVDGNEVANDDLVFSNDDKRVSIPVDEAGQTGSQVVVKYKKYDADLPDGGC